MNEFYMVASMVLFILDMLFVSFCIGLIGNAYINEHPEKEPSLKEGPVINPFLSDLQEGLKLRHLPLYIGGLPVIVVFLPCAFLSYSLISLWEWSIETTKRWFKTKVQPVFQKGIDVIERFMNNEGGIYLYKKKTK